jgi:peptidoglycan/xylan/chitin deacetylase (PgdA/CDA1 family)
MLAWHEIREMHDWGIDFGAHTLTHPDLTSLSLDRVEAEIRGSKEIVEDALGGQVECFAYPYGRHDRPSREIVRQHFACACSDRLGLARGGSDPYALERVDAYYLRSDRLFGVMLTGWLPWYLGARRIPRRIRRLLQQPSPRGEWEG